jgi:hypothetical protein
MGLLLADMPRKDWRDCDYGDFVLFGDAPRDWDKLSETAYVRRHFDDGRVETWRFKLRYKYTQPPMAVWVRVDETGRDPITIPLNL